MNYETSKIFIVKSLFETISVELNSFKTRKTFFLYLNQILNDKIIAFVFTFIIFKLLEFRCAYKSFDIL